MRTPKSSWRVRMLVLAVALAWTASAEAAHEDAKVLIPAQPTARGDALWMALTQGYFKEEKLDVTVKWVATGSELLGSVETYNARYAHGIRHTATLTFGPDGRLLDYEPPPSYGMRDERLPVPAFKAIREQCRAEHPEDKGERRPFRDYPYHTCVVSRLAIWGIE